MRTQTALLLLNHTLQHVSRPKHIPSDTLLLLLPWQAAQVAGHALSQLEMNAILRANPVPYCISAVGH